jgi:hypothetical protein
MKTAYLIKWSEGKWTASKVFSTENAPFIATIEIDIGEVQERVHGEYAMDLSYEVFAMDIVSASFAFKQLGIDCEVLTGFTGGAR